MPSAPEPSKHLTPADDIWGNYLAKWKTPDKSKYEKPKPAEPWKPASYQPFDFGNYLLRSRGPAVDGEPEAPRKSYWWEQPKLARAPGKQLAWWDKLIAEKNAPVVKGPPVDIVPGPHGKVAVVEKPPPPAYPVYAPKTNYNAYVPPKVVKSGPLSSGGKFWWQK